jgi:hypothetical protein
LELAVVVHALKILRHYIIDKRCEVYLDHKSLKYIFTHSDLNLRQRRWLELIKDYDLGINYHPSKANVVADSLRRRSLVNMLATRELLPEFCKDFEKLNLGWVSSTEVITMEVDSTLEQDIRKCQLEDAKIQEIKELILREVHDSAYSIHPGSTKMYHDLKSRYWWYGMKRVVAEYDRDPQDFYNH